MVRIEERWYLLIIGIIVICNFMLFVAFMLEYPMVRAQLIEYGKDVGRYELIQEIKRAPLDALNETIERLAADVEYHLTKEGVVPL